MSNPGFVGYNPSSTNDNSSSSYGGGASYSYAGGAGAAGASYPSPQGEDDTAAGHTGLHRRTTATTTSHGNGNGGDTTNGKGRHTPRNRAAVVEQFDFMFPKVDREFTVQTKGGGVASLLGLCLVAILCLAEIVTWMSQNRGELTQTFVDTSLGQKMRVNINITFPALACDDLHLDMIDVAGDSQIDIVDTLKKRKLHLNGKVFSKDEIDVEVNVHRDQQTTKERVLAEGLPVDYCGPCYGAQEEDGQCCQTCDGILMAYSKKRWKTDLLKYTAEQCIREGRDKSEPKKMTKGQGCNLSGFMTVGRVSGNFHIAMGEGIERDGRHIHTYLPEDAPNFNSSHVIHQLSFGPEDDNRNNGKGSPLNGVAKIVAQETGTTGLFQYFIKVVPTTYYDNAVPTQVVGDSGSDATVKRSDNSNALETNRYFFTERFMPLMTELLEDEHFETDSKKAAVNAGPGGAHSHDHHFKQNSVLPGVFFIYEIYPFAVEIRKNNVPFTHLFIRLMATIGGVFTLARWADSCLYERAGSKNQHSR